MGKITKIQNLIRDLTHFHDCFPQETEYDKAIRQAVANAIEEIKQARNLMSKEDTER